MVHHSWSTVHHQGPQLGLRRGARGASGARAAHERRGTRALCQARLPGWCPRWWCLGAPGGSNGRDLNDRITELELQQRDTDCFLGFIGSNQIFCNHNGYFSWLQGFIAMVHCKGWQLTTRNNYQLDHGQWFMGRWVWLMAVKGW